MKLAFYSTRKDVETDEERIDRTIVYRMRLTGPQEQRRVISPRQWTITAKKEAKSDCNKKYLVGR